MTSKMTNGGHIRMFGIAVIDVPSLSARYVRAALPQAPVIEDERRRRLVVAVRAKRR